MRGVGWLVVVALVAALAGCPSARTGGSGGGQCAIATYSPYVAGGGEKLESLAEARPFRSYYSITDVSPPAHLYTVWYHDVEPTVIELRATEDADGTIHVAQSGGYWGGLGVAPDKRPPPPPADVDRFTAAVKQAVAPCAGDDPIIAYQGRHRVLIAHEMIPHAGNAGWYAKATLYVDDALSTIEHSDGAESGFGTDEPLFGARWVAYTPPPGVNGDRLLLAGDPPPDLAAALLGAARDADAGRPALTLASVVSASASDPALLPAGYDQVVRAEISIYGRADDFAKQQGGMYHVPMHLRDAVFGPAATGVSVITIGKTRFTLGATLTSSTPRSPSGRASDAFTGTLAIRVDGGPKRKFERSFAATGPLELDGANAVAPTGFVLPGGDSSDPAHDLLHVELPGEGIFTSFDVYVGISVFSDPRE